MKILRLAKAISNGFPAMANSKPVHCESRSKLMFNQYAANHHHIAWVTIICLSISLLISAQPVSAEDEGYLSSLEVGALTVSSLGVLAFSEYLKGVYGKSDPHWTQPPGIDLWFANRLGTRPRTGPLNFMDSQRASSFNVLLAGSMVAVLDAAYPEADKTKDVLQGQFLYYSGLLTQRGVGGIFKAVVGRQRPIAYNYPELIARDSTHSNAFYKQSFFSGHASSSFYAMTFLNKRIRGVMRRQMTDSEFKSWSWLSPVITYSWATFVAGSRIHAHKHYFTDILAGAVAGLLIGELFYSFGDDVHEKSSEPILIRVAFNF